ncbi:ATP-binding protein [Actinoplanes sp. N902-109]|uniref:ATP-binding protein n=1 Tax=Actinoplanes sp. (strain N902-109) TaxID=649831 RepID=UPI00032958D3|nr:ATP-binding protein [Actinoplanes sp. N902-109]AGL13684.1 putative anti-sigma regulatory factor, serine/threonine protein kinase [Actinoplanes sp. N902-109]
MANTESRLGLLELPFTGTDLYTLRSAVAAHVAEVADQPTTETAVLIAHELCSNAVRHGGGSGRLRIWLSGVDLHLEVSDSGFGLARPDEAGRTLPPLSVPGGRGLWIARRMSRVQIVTGGTGTIVTAVVQLCG